MVEWKKLGEITNIIRGSRVTKSELLENGLYPVISGGVSPLGYIDKYNREPNTITIAQYGSAGYVDYQQQKFWANDVCYSVYPKPSIDNKFLFYALVNKQYEIYSLRTNAVPAHLPLKTLQEVQIPIPSIEEQNRIVGILDTFTDSIENLKQQIAQRRKQYVYLIDNAFGGSLSEMKKKAEKGTLHVEPLSAHGTFTRGRRFVRTDVVEEGQPCIHYGDMYTYYGLYANKANTHLPYDFPKKMRYAKKGDVVIVGAGENNEDIAVGLVWLGDEPAAVHDACYIYESDFEPMFLSYFLRSSIYHLQIKSHVVRGKICSISSDGIGKALIPIYSMERQKEIVSNLLPFESLLNNLEAQLVQRQKQYEYYRNKLLTFE